LRIKLKVVTGAVGLLLGCKKTGRSHDTGMDIIGTAITVDTGMKIGRKGPMIGVDGDQVSSLR
jgi:hypothetical protein